MELLIQFSALFLRAIGLLILLPLGGAGVGHLMRASLALCLAIVFFEPLKGSAIGINDLVFEFFIGMLIGLPTALVVGAAAMWAELVDSGRGQSVSLLYDPLSGQTSNASTSLARYAVWASILVLGVLEQLIGAYAASLDSFVVGASVALPWDVLGEEYLKVLMPILTQTFQLYLPFGIVFLFVDFGFGVIGKLVPQLNPFGETFLLKTLASIAIVVLISRSDLPFSLFEMATPPQIDFMLQS